MQDEDTLNFWESDSSDDDSDDSTVASSMLTLDFLMDEPQRKKKGKGKSGTPMPAPKKVTSLGGSSKLPCQQQTESETISIDKDEILEMPHEVAMEVVGTAFSKVMEGHFAKLYLKIDNQKTEVSRLKITVVSLVEEDKMLGEVRGNAPDPEKQPSTTPQTSKMDLSIRPACPLAPQKQVGTPLAREILERNWAKQVEKDNATPMNINESDAEPGRPGKTPRLTSPPPSLIHSQYAASAKVQIDYRLRYVHKRTHVAHSKLPVDPCATRSL